jgi:hypothetical protein
MEGGGSPRRRPVEPKQDAEVRRASPGGPIKTRMAERPCAFLFEGPHTLASRGEHGVVSCSLSRSVKSNNCKKVRKKEKES